VNRHFIFKPKTAKFFYLFLACAMLACESLDQAPLSRQSGKPTKPTTTTATQPTPQPLQSENQWWTTLRASVKKQNWIATLEATEALLKFPPRTPALTAELYHSRVSAFLGQKDAVNAILMTEQAALQTTTPEKDRFISQGADLIVTSCSKDCLVRLKDSLTQGPWKALVALHAGQMSAAERDSNSARNFYAQAVNLAPESEAGKQARDLLAQIEAARKVDPRTIGVALPLTGKYAPIGQKVLRGIELGLGLDGGETSSIRLAISDTEGNSDKARRCVDQLVKEDSVLAIVGSVLSKTATAVASRANELGVPSMTLSQKAGVTELGPLVFRNSLTNEMLIRKLVHTAMQEKGWTRFAVIYPNDAYGVEATNLFWDEVRARGGQVVAAQTYAPSETDFRNVVQRLVKTYYIEDRAEEYRVRLRNWSANQSRHGANRNAPPEDLLPPVVDFDAIFIPDDAKALGQIAAMLSFNNVRGVPLLGTNLWNVPGLAKRAGNFSKSLIFVDSIVADNDAFKATAFAKEYRATYGEYPGLFEVQGYDAALLMRKLLQTGGTKSREGMASALTQVQDFDGALGKVSMLKSRELARPVFALTLQNNEVAPLPSQSNLE